MDFEHRFDTDGSIAGLADCMQNIAGMHAETMGYGYNDMLAKGELWALSRLSISVKYSAGGTIDMHTSSAGTDGLYYYRDYSAYEKSELIAQGSSAWIIMDLETRMPKRNAGTGFPEISDSYDKPVKLARMHLSNAECSFRVHENDLDINKHVNNVTYIKWVVKYSGFSNISALDINFIKECFIDDEISVYLSQGNNGIVLQNSGRDIARAIVTPAP